MNHVMIDIETLSTEPNAVIVELAAVPFDMRSTGESFSAAINPDSCLKVGLHVSMDTIKWHSINSKIIPVHGTASLLDALMYFRSWAGDLERESGKELVFWANSPSFDLVILRSAYKAINVEPFWKYWQERDMRTVMSLLPKRMHMKNSHVALEDCVVQINCLKQALNELNLTLK